MKQDEEKQVGHAVFNGIPADLGVIHLKELKSSEGVPTGIFTVAGVAIADVDTTKIIVGMADEMPIMSVIIHTEHMGSIFTVEIINVINSEADPNMRFIKFRSVGQAGADKLADTHGGTQDE